MAIWLGKKRALHHSVALEHAPLPRVCYFWCEMTCLKLFILNSPPLHSTQHHSTHYITLHYITLHYITLHWSGLVWSGLRGGLGLAVQSLPPIASPSGPLTRYASPTLPTFHPVWPLASIASGPHPHPTPLRWKQDLPRLCICRAHNQT